MGCGCGASTTGPNGTTSQSKTVYVHTRPDGSTDSYQSEVEVAAAVSRQGGTYRIGT